MADFGFSVLFSVLITLATLLADWVAGRFVYLSRTVSRINRDIDSVVEVQAKLDAVQRHLEELREKNASALVWGADLATVALAMELATLAVWSKTPELFPFLMSFNTGDANRENQVWASILVVHAVFLLLSLICRHLHTDLVASISRIPGILSIKWWTSNRWMLGSNATGFISLLLSFVVMTNSRPF